MSTTVRGLKVLGSEQLVTNLQQLSRRLSKKVVTEALLLAAEPMQQIAAQLAPRRPGEPDLADHIVVMPVDDKRNRRDVSVAYGPSREFFYGIYQEYGTGHHRAQPFMRPSFDRGGRTAVNRFKSEVWAALIRRGFGSARAGGGGGGTL